MPAPRSSAIILGLLLLSTTADAARCVYISSYHNGYAWSDGVERGLLKTLGDKCEVTIFNMNTKRVKDEESIKKVALEARQLIDTTQPDVVIASDDNASKYLIVPYFKDADIPFVFCGVNWTVEKYGYPFSNVTGMIEVAAVDQMFDKATGITGDINHVTYIGADTLTEKKNLARFESAGRRNNITLTSYLVATMSDWIEAYTEAQQADLIIIGSKAGIDDWDREIVVEMIHPISMTLTATNHGWMMPYTMFGMTKIPEEHGEWAATVAIEILKGTKPSRIPIIPNRNFDIIVNNSLLNSAEIKLPEFIKLKAQTYD